MTEEERKRFYAKISRLDFAGPDRWETWGLGEGMTFIWMAADSGCPAMLRRRFIFTERFCPYFEQGVKRKKRLQKNL